MMSRVLVWLVPSLLALPVSASYLDEYNCYHGLAASGAVDPTDGNTIVLAGKGYIRSEGGQVTKPPTDAKGGFTYAEEKRDYASGTYKYSKDSVEFCAKGKGPLAEEKCSGTWGSAEARKLLLGRIRAAISRLYQLYRELAKPGTTSSGTRGARPAPKTVEDFALQKSASMGVLQTCWKIGGKIAELAARELQVFERAGPPTGDASAAGSRSGAGTVRTTTDRPGTAPPANRQRGAPPAGSRQRRGG